MKKTYDTTVVFGNGQEVQISTRFSMVEKDGVMYYSHSFKSAMWNLSFTDILIKKAVAYMVEKGIPPTKFNINYDREHNTLGLVFHVGNKDRYFLNFFVPVEDIKCKCLWDLSPHMWEAHMKYDLKLNIQLHTTESDYSEAVITDEVPW